MKISEYTQAKSFEENDFLLKDGTNGTKIIKARDAANSFLSILSDSCMHANIYRGKNLGTSITDEQKTAITNGTFNDLFVGDYWTINNRVYRIADMNYFYGIGDTACKKHHLVIVPDAIMYQATMNDTAITTGGYVNSLMRTTNLEQATNKIKSDFGNIVITHKDYLINATSGNSSSGGAWGAWMDSTVELMNEIMIYGCHITAKGYYQTAKMQFSMFRLNSKKLHTEQWFWLRDVVTSSYFALVDASGNAIDLPANTSIGVRPYFIIG